MDDNLGDDLVADMVALMEAAARVNKHAEVTRVDIKVSIWDFQVALEISPTNA